MRFVTAPASPLGERQCAFVLMSIYLMFACVCVQGCSGDEREMGKAISNALSKQDKQVVMEGQEPAEFWVALGGKAPYASDKR